MTHTYPHLTQATPEYPNVAGVAPYAQYRNTFDYDRWTAGTKLTVCNVPWDDVRNIVEWESDAARDRWFENLGEAERVTLDTEFHKLPDGTIKLPIPFCVLSRCNYLWVVYPTPTTSADPLDHADGPRTHAWGYFIERPRQLAANTTECALRLDNWTTFGTHIGINYMQLKRGHAPMAATDADAYLSNPIENAGMLLAPDVSYGPDAGITRDHTFIPLNSGEKYVMFNSLVAPDQLKSLGAAVEWEGESTDPTYADTADRWGHQWRVDGYEWRMGDMNYANTNTPVKPLTVGADAPTGGTAYAIKAVDAEKLFDAIVKTVPQFMQTIQGMWIVPGDMINVTDAPTHTIAGVTVYEAQTVNDMPDINVKLTKEMFAYPDEYKNIAKLYTFPYACLNVSDNDGVSVDIRIENTGNLTVHRRVSLAYPYLKAQAFLTGVNGTGAKTYEWRDLTGAAREEKSWDSDWADYMIKWDIPTYGLYMDGYRDWAVHNQQANLDINRLKALNAYHVSQRANNTGYENTIAAADATRANAQRSADVSYSNSKSTADTAQSVGDTVADVNMSNAKRSADTAQTNANASAGTGKTNADASVNTALLNSNAAADTANVNTQAANNTANANVHRAAETMLANNANDIETVTENMNTQLTNSTANNSISTGGITDSLLNTQLAQNQNLAASNDLIQLNTNLTKENAGVSFAIGGAKQLASGVASTINGGVGAATQALSGSFGGAIGTAVGTQLNNATGIVNFGLDALQVAYTMTNNQTLTSGNKNCNKFMLENTQTADTSNAKIQVDNAGEIVKNNNAMIKSVTEKANDNSKTNTKNNADTSKANSDNATSTGNANSARSYETSVANNQRAYDTGIANNKRGYDTAVANAQRAHDVSYANAEASNTVTHQANKRNHDNSYLCAGANYGVANQNADMSQTLAKTNASESRESAEYGNKTALEQAQDVAELTYRNQTNAAPKTYGTYAGDPTPDLMRYRGLQIRVKTQNESAIRQTGDQFLRYGYAYEGNWNATKLAVMPKYTYWECGEVWLSADTSILEEAREHVRGMLETGVTVWTAPEYIGKVGIHDNE